MALNSSKYHVATNNHYDVIIGENTCCGNESVNTTVNENKDITEERIAFLCIELVFMTGSLSANGLVLLAFINNRHLRINVTNFYLLQLSLANFMMGIVSVLHIVTIIVPEMLTNDYGCLSRFATMLVVCGFSSLSLLAISYDRFLAIAGPLYYRARICKRRVLIHCVLIYSIPTALFLVIPFIWKDTLEADDKCSMVAIFEHQYLAFIVIPFYLILTTILILLFVITVYLNHRRMHTIKKLVATMPFNWKRNSAHKRSGRLTKTSGLVLASFLVCWMPFFVTLMTQVYGGIQNSTMHAISLVAFLPILFNSALTPMLYVYRLSTFRSSIKKMFCKDQYLQEMKEYETSRLLQRRNAIRHIRDSYDSVTTVMDSGLFTSMISEESEFETETEISEIPEYDVIDQGMRRRSSFQSEGALWVNEENEYMYETLENGQQIQNGDIPHYSHEKLNGYLNGTKRLYTEDILADNLTGHQLAGQARRHSSPLRKPSLPTIHQDEILKIALDTDRYRRGSSPEFTDPPARDNIAPLSVPDIKPPLPAKLERRRNSVLQDIPEGGMMQENVAEESPETSPRIQNKYSHNLLHKFTRSKKPIRRESLPKLEAFEKETSENVPRLYARRTSSPQVLSHYRIAEKRRKSIGEVKRGRSRTVLETPSCDEQFKVETTRKASLPTIQVPSIIIDDLTVPAKDSIMANGTEVLKNGSVLDAHMLSTQTNTASEHTDSSDNSSDNLLISSNGSFAGTATNRRKSSLLQELTAPIARRLSSLFKHMDVSKGGGLTPTKAPSTKLRDRLLRRKSRCDGDGDTSHSRGESPGESAGGIPGESGSFSNLDRVLVDIVKEDPSIVLELLEDLEELLHEDQQLSAVVLNDMKRRAEQAMLLSQQTQRRPSSFRRIFLGNNDVNFDTMTSSAHNKNRRSTLCASYDLRTAEACNGNRKQHEAVYTIPYGGTMRRKQRSLAHIYDTHWQRSPEIARKGSPDIARKPVGFNENMLVGDNTVSDNKNKHVFRNNDDSHHLGDDRQESNTPRSYQLSDFSHNKSSDLGSKLNCHKPLTKCVQIPLARTHQAKDDLMLLNQISCDDHQKLDRMENGPKGSNQTAFQITQNLKLNGLHTCNFEKVPSILVSDLSMSNNHFPEGSYENGYIKMNSRNQENKGVCDNYQEMKLNVIQPKDMLGNTTKCGIGRFDRRNSYTLVQDDNLLRCPHSES